MTRATCSQRSCAASCRPTRSARLPTRWPSWTSCRDAKGHALVIPKTPARNVLDATPAQLAACLATVQTIARAQIKAFGAQGITIQQFNEAAGGQVVFHLHYHVIPRWDGVKLGPHTATMEKPEVLAASAEKIRKALTGC